jgi:hypothetical protein
VPVISDFSKLYPGFELGIIDTIKRSFSLTELKKVLRETLSPPEHFLIKQVIV